MKPIVMLLAVAVMALPDSAHAQESVAPGARIRLVLNQGQPVVATLRVLSADSITYTAADGVQHSLPRADITVLEQSVGRKKDFWRHFGIAWGVVTLAGAIISSATWTECRSTEFLGCFLEPESRSEAFAWGGLAGAVVGTPVGLIAGLAITRERWEPISSYER